MCNGYDGQQRIVISIKSYAMGGRLPEQWVTMRPPWQRNLIVVYCHLWSPKTDQSASALRAVTITHLVMSLCLLVIISLLPFISTYVIQLLVANLNRQIIIIIINYIVNSFKSHQTVNRFIGNVLLFLSSNQFYCTEFNLRVASKVINVLLLLLLLLKKLWSDAAWLWEESTTSPLVLTTSGQIVPVATAHDSSSSDHPLTPSLGHTH